LLLTGTQTFRSNSHSYTGKAPSVCASTIDQFQVRRFGIYFGGGTISYLKFQNQLKQIH